MQINIKFFGILSYPNKKNRFFFSVMFTNSFIACILHSWPGYNVSWSQADFVAFSSCTLAKQNALLRTFFFSDLSRKWMCYFWWHFESVGCGSSIISDVLWHLISKNLAELIFFFSSNEPKKVPSWHKARFQKNFNSLYLAIYYLSTIKLNAGFTISPLLGFFNVFFMHA